MQHQKIKTLSELLKITAKLKSDRKTIVFKSGVFDILHPGHTRAIRRSKEEGDILVLAFHGDAMTKARKGRDRPHVTLSDRMEVLADNCNIDYMVSVGSQADLYEIILTISPDVLVVSETSTQGNDNTPETMRKMFEKHMKIVVLAKLGENHVTDIVERIRNS